MADWFKFYENDLDETRLQYAISKLPEVIPVWVGILSEACRHKVGTLSWGSDEIELFGFSRRLGVSIPKVNEAINILAEIRYIAKGEDSITVIKWGEKQSEYCQKRTKHQNQTGENHHTKTNSVPTVSRQCPDSVGQEERRGEENRREETKKVASLPSVDAFELYPNLNTPEFKAAWQMWIENRKQRKKVLTIHARDLQLAKLSKFGHERAIQSIKLSIENSWTGLFEPKPEPKPEFRRSGGQSTSCIAPNAGNSGRCF